MAKWILILALNFSDGGTIVQQHDFETKEACEAALAVTITAVHATAVNPFLWAGDCMDLSNPPKNLTPPGDKVPPPTQKPKATPSLPTDKKQYRAVLY